MVTKIGEVVVSYDFDNLNEISSIIDASKLSKLKSNINKLVEDINLVFSTMKETNRKVTDVVKEVIKDEDKLNSINEIKELYNYFISESTKSLFNETQSKIIQNYISICYNWSRLCNSDESKLKKILDDFWFQYKKEKFTVVFTGKEVSDNKTDERLKTEDIKEFKKLE